MKIKNLLKKSIFLKSFKLDRRFFFVLLFDLIFVLLIISLIPLYTYILRLNLDAMKPLDDSAKRVEQMVYGAVHSDQPIGEDIMLVSLAIRAFFSRMIVISIISLILGVVAIGFIKGYSWSKLLNEKPNNLVCLKFSLLILIWNLFWVLLLLFIVFALRFRIDIIQIIVLIEFLIYVYLSLIITPIFFRNKSILKTIKQTFLLGLFKFYRLIPSFIVVVVLLSITSAFVRLFLFIPNALSILPALLLSLMYLVWMKFYMNLVVERFY